MSVKTELNIFSMEIAEEFDRFPEQVLDDISEFLRIKDIMPKENHTNLIKSASVSELQECVDDSDLEEYDKVILKFLLSFDIIDNQNDLWIWMENIKNRM